MAWQPREASHPGALGPGTAGPSLADPRPGSAQQHRSAVLHPTCGAQAFAVSSAAGGSQPRRHTQCAAFRALLCDAPHTQKHCSNASANVSQRGSPQTLPVWTGPGLPRCSGSDGVLPARLPYYYMGGALRALTEALLRFRETLCAMGRVWRRRGPHSRFAAAGISSAHHSAPLNACDWTGRGAGTLT